MFKNSKVKHVGSAPFHTLTGTHALHVQLVSEQKLRSSYQVFADKW